ncbi:cell division protein FtsQ/DivIB [Methylomicrobium sp. Wu6]|uniref:cell division protein FtsQ/DivIB n=1 Tax=Methylomicrobium sp. Wu6 TaxID=3107928 RepID=UPI002DD65D6F|nr:cell division protein FtsQ/DivIB [Methylomicrobium sp. Wu6]MEC4748999.1 cell division protein FtsQ/DivIB [Methylomicrobium sp. Wu6]
MADFGDQLPVTMNASWKILAALCVIAALFWRFGHGVKVYGPDVTPVRYVRIGGVFQYLTKDEIKNTLLPLVQAGFLATDMQAVHDAVAKLPWVDGVEVKRVWPDAIDIRVREKTAFARWRDNSLITEQGVIFSPRNVEQFLMLPKVSGPERQEQKVLEIMKGVTTALADQVMVLTEFTVNERWSWKIRLTNGMEILLGREDQLKKLQRFLRTLPVLGAEQAGAIAIADLRYPNGYAITWWPDAPPIDWSKLADPKPAGEQNTNKAIQSKKHGKKNRT